MILTILWRTSNRRTLGRN